MQQHSIFLVVPKAEWTIVNALVWTGSDKKPTLCYGKCVPFDDRRFFFPQQTVSLPKGTQGIQVIEKIWWAHVFGTHNIRQPHTGKQWDSTSRPLAFCNLCSFPQKKRANLNKDPTCSISESCFEICLRLVQAAFLRAKDTARNWSWIKAEFRFLDNFILVHGNHT